ncbi:MAG: hypothetical protein ABI895_26540 [Deltaproteobacteria bacterium]
MLFVPRFLSLSSVLLMLPLTLLRIGLRLRLLWAVFVVRWLRPGNPRP